MLRRVSSLYALLVFFSAGCAHSQLNDTSSGRTMVDEDEIESLHVATAYDVVSRTHAEYLHSRGRESLDSNLRPIPAHVYVDDTFYGDIATLASIPASELSAIIFYQAFEAQYKFGSGHMGGVIQLITKR